jgi:hypothetical protein
MACSRFLCSIETAVGPGIAANPHKTPTQSPLIAPYVVNPTEGIWFRVSRKDFSGECDAPPLFTRGMQRTMVATTEGNASSPAYQPRKQGWLFWLARAQVSDFAQTASVQAGIVPSGGLWDRCLLVFWRLPVPASHYFHPDFGYLCPTQRFRRGLRLALTCLAMALAGAGVMGIFSAPKLIPAVPPDQASTAETNPTTTPTPYAAVDLRPAMAKGAQIVVAGRPSCAADTRPERQLRLSQATRTANGLGGERSLSNRCHCSRPPRTSNDRHQ